MMKYKWLQFMQGRYGVDDLSRFLLGLSLAGILLDFFLKSRIFYSLTLILVLFVYFRMFSRNIGKRYQENMKFLQIKGRILGLWTQKRDYLRQYKTHHIYKCPTCRQKIRVPRGKGKISIHCPKCHTDFIKKS